MTFPNRTFASAADYGDAYFEEINRATKTVPRDRLSAAASLMGEIYKTGGTLFICGNGGSAALSNQMVCDHMKCIRTDTNLVPRLVSLATTMETLTAIANDISYDEVFAYQLQSLGRKGDGLFTISASGDSENVVRALTWAKDKGLKTVSLTGFDGGRSAKLSDVNIHVEADNYGIIEDVHQSITHVLGQYLRLSEMDPGLIPQRKF